jgi:hypothetical protein
MALIKGFKFATSYSIPRQRLSGLQGILEKDERIRQFVALNKTTFKVEIDWISKNKF